MILPITIIALMFHSQIGPGPTVVKKFDGTSWSVVGLIETNWDWNRLLDEFRQEKTIYSHGSCCYNKNFVNGIKIEGEDIPWTFIIDDASPIGRTEQLQMYWREKFTVEDPFEPGFSKIASKKLSDKIRKYVNNKPQMEKSTHSLLRRCIGAEDDQLPYYCRRGINISDKKEVSAKDSTQYTTTQMFHVFVNPKTKIKQPDKWVSILDSLGIIAQVPSTTMLKYDSLLKTKQTLNKTAAESLQRNNIALMLWALARFECAIIDKNSGVPKRQIFRATVMKKCGDMCDEYSQYIYLNDDFRIFERGHIQ